MSRKKVERIEKACLICGKEMFLVPSYSHTMYCSNSCRYSSRVVNRVKKNCLLCAKEMHLLPSKANKTCCSDACSRIASRTDDVIMKPCLTCGITMRLTPKSHKQKYCSNECKHKREYIPTAAKGREYVGRIKKNCFKCNKEMLLIPSMSDKKYCSNTCKYSNIVRASRAKVKLADVIDIRDRYKKLDTKQRSGSFSCHDRADFIRDLMEEYKVCKSTIDRILDNRTWTDKNYKPPTFYSNHNMKSPLYLLKATLRTAVCRFKSLLS